MSSIWFLRVPAAQLTEQLESVRSIEELEKLCSRMQMSGLRQAITQIEEQQSVNFWQELFPKLIEWLNEPTLPKSINLFLAGRSHTERFTHRQLRSILAHALFFNIRSVAKPSFGCLELSQILISDDSISRERTKCLLGYFVRELRYPVDDAFINDIEISRIFVPREHFPDWSKVNQVIRPDLVHVHTGRMEDCVGEWNPREQQGKLQSKATIVDFANKQIHIGTVIPSMTQEEVLFSCASECFICLLAIETLGDQEVVLIRNIRRAVEYTGYLLSFRQTDLLPNAAPMDMLVLDASFHSSFSESQIIRDLNKAWIGFSHCVTRPISTGHWGCGAFGGNKTCKFLQQVCVATLLNIPLEYSTFNSLKCKTYFDEILQKMAQHSITVSQIVSCLCHFLPYTRDTKSIPFETFLNNWLASFDPPVTPVVPTSSSVTIKTESSDMVVDA